MFCNRNQKLTMMWSWVFSFCHAAAATVLNRILIMSITTRQARNGEQKIHRMTRVIKKLLMAVLMRLLRLITFPWDTEGGWSLCLAPEQWTRRATIVMQQLTTDGEDGTAHYEPPGEPTSEWHLTWTQTQRWMRYPDGHLIHVVVVCPQLLYSERLVILRKCFWLKVKLNDVSLHFAVHTAIKWICFGLLIPAVQLFFRNRTTITPRNHLHKFASFRPTASSSPEVTARRELVENRRTKTRAPALIFNLPAMIELSNHQGYLKICLFFLGNTAQGDHKLSIMQHSGTRPTQ